MTDELFCSRIPISSSSCEKAMDGLAIRYGWAHVIIGTLLWEAGSRNWDGNGSDGEAYVPSRISLLTDTVLSL